MVWRAAGGGAAAGRARRGRVFGCRRRLDLAFHVIPPVPASPVAPVRKTRNNDIRGIRGGESTRRGVALGRKRPRAHVAPMSQRRCRFVVRTTRKPPLPCVAAVRSIKTAKGAESKTATGGQNCGEAVHFELKTWRVFGLVMRGALSGAALAADLSAATPTLQFNHLCPPAARRDPRRRFRPQLDP